MDIDITVIWFIIIVFATLMYIVMDGFDLGIGMLFSIVHAPGERDVMVNSVAPVWDGNETWLVLGGAGVFGAFPLAYAVIADALAIPLTMMLIGLIFRGVAFEFRFKASTRRHVWDTFFFIGSVVATFSQGIMLGALVQGLEASNRLYTGGPFDWLTPFSIVCGFALIIGYALLGSTWLIIKTEHTLQVWARKVSGWMLSALVVAMIIVTIFMYFSDIDALEGWFRLPSLLYLAPMPVIALILFFIMRKDLTTEREYRPFLLTVALFLMGYIGVCFALFPYIVPYQMTIYEAAAADTSLSFMLIGAVIMLPIILSYTAFAYYTFKGKTDHNPMY